MALLRDAEDAWQALRESGDPINSGAVPGASYDTAYYQLSDREFRMIHSRPSLKEFLIANSGMHAVPEDQEAA